MTRIHPTAVVDRSAQLDSQVSVGPCAVIEAGVTIGSGCSIEAHAVVHSGTQLGRDNLVACGAVLGGRPQHLKAGRHCGRLVIGDGNMIREHATIHRGLHGCDVTMVGDRNMIMVAAHIAHDCRLEHEVILANNVMLAGHVTIGHHAYLSGAVGVHQFCRIGPYAMLGGQAHITQDVPPGVTVDGASSRLVGLNQLGLRRAGVGPDAVGQMKKAYRLIYRSGLPRAEALARLRTNLERPGVAPLVREFYEFIASSQRGCVSERHAGRRSILKVFPPAPAAQLDDGQGEPPRHRTERAAARRRAA